MTIRAFNPSPAGAPGRDVVSRFLRKDGKKVADARVGSYDALRFLENTPVIDCKRVGKNAERSRRRPRFRWDLRHRWLRIFVAYYPSGTDVVVLHVVLKKTNSLDDDDIKHAINNFNMYGRRIEGAQ